MCLKMNLSEKIENLDVDNKMSHTCGPFEPINSTQSALFRGVMVLYFLLFIYDHPIVLGLGYHFLSF